MARLFLQNSVEMWGGIINTGASDLHAISSQCINGKCDSPPQPHLRSPSIIPNARSESSTKVRQLLLKMGGQFAFDQKGQGTNEPRKPTFDRRPSLKFLEGRRHMGATKNFRKVVGQELFKFWKITKSSGLHVYGPECPQSL